MKKKARLLLLLCLLAAACGDRRLPQIGVYSACVGGAGAGGEAPSVCSWAAGSAAVVLGTVKDIDVVTLPSSTCAVQDPALAIDLQVDEVLGGAAPAEVRIVVAPGTFAQWRPMPLLRSDGTLAWTFNENDERAEPIVRGQKLGARIQKNGDGTTWVAGRLFGPRGARLVEQDVTTAECAPAADLELGSIAGLREALRDCSFAEKARRTTVGPVCHDDLSR